jgi:RimJ/RimL family protein N-acetyltransferase
MTRRIDMLSGERIYLRALEPEDYLVSWKWRNDHDLLKGLINHPRSVSKETERKWVLRAIEEHETGVAVRLAICTKEGDRHIGYVYLTDIDHQNKDCKINTLIGDRAFINKGLVQEIRFLVAKYAFMELGMNRLSSLILDTNIASIKSGERFGYVKEGILRKAIYRDGQYHDAILYSMLREEFLTRYFPDE